LEDESPSLGSGTVLGIADGLDLVLISNNEVLVQFGSRSYPSELLRDQDLTGILGKIIGSLLKGPSKLGDLLSSIDPKHKEEASKLITDLVGRGFLSDVTKSPIEQYLGYTFDGQSTLTERTISLIGAGPIGARLAQSFLQHGIGRITLLDERKADRFWCCNLPPFPTGMRPEDSRVDALLREQLAAAVHARVEALHVQFDATGAEAAVERSDFTVVALEQPDLRFTHLINRAAIRHRKPWLLATIDGNFGLIGPLFVPVHTACYNDYRTLSDAASRTPHMTRKYREHMLQRGIGPFFPGLPVYAEIVAAHASLAVLHFLLRDSSFALGRVLSVDFDRMMIDVEDVLKLPRCPICADEAIAHQPPFSAEIVTRYASLKHEA
jgi:bacteriocin biosynthesis cyclodehydratase domain-containing protein